MAFYSSMSSLLGAMHVNRGLAARGAAQDPGGKIAALISAVNVLTTNVSLIQVAVMSANASAVGLSSLSGITFASTYSTIPNFSS
jgi:hypothetical protein